MKPVNWSLVCAVIGDMLDNDELQPARVRLPDGSIAEVVRFEKDAQGQWLLVAQAIEKQEMP